MRQEKEREINTYINKTKEKDREKYIKKKENGINKYIKLRK